MAIKVFGKIGNQDIHRLHHMCLPFFLNLESKVESVWFPSGKRVKRPYEGMIKRLIFSLVCHF